MKLLAITWLACIAVAGISGVSVAQSEPGKFKTTQVEFAKLADATRSDRGVPIKVHVPVGKGPFPVVIVSHGAGGNLDANFAQAKHLATHGYIAVCLEHVGSNTKQVRAGGLRIGKTTAAMTRRADEVLNRPKDVGFAIDRCTAWNKTHAKLRSRFDMKRIGILGHSFGAYTTLAVCGARPALDWLEPKVGKGAGLGPDLSDKRVLCGVALSPQGPGEPFFLAEQLPFHSSTAAGDFRKPGQTARQHADTSQTQLSVLAKRDRYLLWINNATHLQFSDSTGSKQRQFNIGRTAERREDVQEGLPRGDAAVLRQVPKEDAASRA